MEVLVCPKCNHFRGRQYDKYGNKHGWFCAECQRIKRHNAKLGIVQPKKDISICPKCGHKRVQKYVDNKKRGWRCRWCDREYKRSRVDHNRKYWHDWNETHTTSAALSSSRWSKKNPEKAAAHSVVHRAIKDGRLVKQPCEVCSNVNVEAHHDDYTQPLNVRWLCKKHHEQQHEINFDD